MKRPSFRSTTTRQRRRRWRLAGDRLHTDHRFLPPSTRHLIVYPTVIDTRWGPSRLRAACERDLGVELDRSTAVLFHIRARDTLVLYTLDTDGDRCITKQLDRGVFLLPVPAAGQECVVLDASKVGALFRR